MGRSDRSRRSASVRSSPVSPEPVSPGMATSSTIRSGCTERIVARASAAEAAVVTRKPFSPR